PYGSVDQPLSPISMAIGAEAGFVARTSDNDVKHMGEVFAAAAAYKGAALVEVLQNCVIFADKIHDPYVGRANRSETLVYLKHGEPLRYGKEMEKGLVMDKMSIRTKENPDESELLV